jgi:hypothetical protein
MSASNVTEEVQALARLNLEELRDTWRQRFGPPPSLRSPDLLRHALAWRLQAASFGALDPETRRQLRRPVSSIPSAPPPAAGTCLAREWKGERFEVEVTGDDFLHRGKRYASLSEVARAITGVRWNGPRFFGLRTADTAR